MADRRRALTIIGVALLGAGGLLALSNQAKPASSGTGSTTSGAGCFAGWSEERKLQLVLTSSWDQISAAYGAPCLAALVSWYAPYRTVARGSFFTGFSDDQLLGLVNTMSWPGIGAQYGWRQASWLYNWYGPRRTS